MSDLQIGRRGLIAASAGLLGLVGASTSAAAQPPAPARLSGKPVIAMLAYPGMFPLDLVAPYSIFASLGTHDVQIVWKSLDIVASGGFAIQPNLTLADCPSDLDVLFVPGGADGTLAMMEDSEVLAFLADRGSRARYVTSVCTGSLVLASAGLLKGRRATGHWLALDALSRLEVEPVRARVVRDGNRVTGAGVTAGSDFALTLAAELSGERLAKAVQLVIEYDPEPPFQAGTPEGAGEDITGWVRSLYAPFTSSLDIVAERVRERLQSA
jgi:cyclohexyl-isocyanide hydratase